jgi:hypothetical protein
MSIKDIASKGRYGDNHLLHVSDAEVQGLNALANSVYGHGLTTNPDTGLPEAFLFAPFLAPLIAGGGASALGLGLTAGALGTAEAAARGMDDPLAQGLMAGLTAGAGSAISSNLGQVGAEAAGQGAIQGTADQLVAGGLDDFAAADAAQLTQQGIGEQAVAQNLGAAGVADPSFVAADAFNANQLAGGQGSAIAQPSMEMAPKPDTFMNRNLPNFGDPSSLNPFGGAGDVARGAEEAFGSQEGFKQFIDQNQMALATGMGGIAGSEGLSEQQRQREAFEAQEADKQKKYDDTVAKIRANYAAAGRQAPDFNSFGAPVFGGPSAFKEGRSVKSPEQQAYEDKTFSKYDEQVAEEPWYTRVPVQVLEKMGIRDPYRLRRAMEVDERAAGGYLEGGIASLKGDGMSDSVPAKIDGSQPAALSTGEYVIPADVVSHLGNGSSDDGAVRLDEMLDRVRMARTGTEDQAPQIKPEKYLPA